MLRVSCISIKNWAGLNKKNSTYRSRFQVGTRPPCIYIVSLPSPPDKIYWCVDLAFTRYCFTLKL